MKGKNVKEKPSPSEFRVVRHPGADLKNKGEWLGHYEPVNAAKTLKEIQKNAK
jgi:hypothetical protein